MTFKIRRPVLIGFLICWVVGIASLSWAAGEQKKVYTVRKAVQEALENNWALKAKEETTIQATESNKAALRDFLPKFSTSYSYTRFRQDTRKLGGFLLPQSRDNYSWTTGLKQPLFTGFRLLSTYDLTKLKINAAKLGVEQEKLDLALKVKQAYFNILIQDKAVEVAQKDVEARKSQAEVARNFYKVGMIPSNQLLQAEVEEANARQALVKDQNQAQLARAAFNQILARPTNAPVDVVDVKNYTIETGTYDKYLKMALKDRPEIMALDNRILQEDQQIRLAKSNYYPDISLVVDYNQAGDTPYLRVNPDINPRDTRAMAVLNWTFFEWGKERHQVLEAESAKRELVNTKNDLVDQMGLQVRQVLLDLKTAETNIPTTKQAVEQAEENVRVSEERYKAQVTTITEVLDAQTRLSQARMNYYTALYAHHLASAQLLRVIGRY